MEKFYVIPEIKHNELVESAYLTRGYSHEEAEHAVTLAAEAARHGIRTHNALKGLELDRKLGSGSKGCVPGAEIEKLPCAFEACEIWNSNRKLGQAVAAEAMDTCMRLADRYGIGMVNVDNTFHYLWGGGHVMRVAKAGYIGYTNCTASYAEVVPFQGKAATIGTNPHSWGLPTTNAIGYPIVIDWATSVIASGRVEVSRREGQSLPNEAAVDKDGNVTRDPNEVVSLMPFGAHKGYGLGLLNELLASLIGGYLPTIRNRWSEAGEKQTCNFHFQVIHPQALSSGAFAGGRTQSDNVRMVIKDVLGHGNEHCLLPGQMEAMAAARSATNGGLLFSEAEIEAFSEIAESCGMARWDVEEFKKAE